MRICDVSAGENAGNRSCGGWRLDCDIALSVEFQLARKEIALRFVADGAEATLAVEGLRCAVLCVLECEAGDAAWAAVYFGDDAVPANLDFWVCEDFVLHRLGSAEAIAAVAEGDFAGQATQKLSFFEGNVSASNDCYLFVSKEESVTGGANADAAPKEFFFAGHAEHFGAGAGRDDERVGGVQLAVAFGDLEGVGAQLDGCDRVVAGFEAEPQGLLFDVFHQIAALNAVWKSWIVFDFAGGGELAAMLKAAGEIRFQACSGAVEAGRQACGSRADDVNAVMNGHVVSLGRLSAAA